MTEITATNIEALNSYLAKGLCGGKGDPAERVCVEAAICLAMGEPFSDQPTCVAGSVREYSIRLNDSSYWNSPASRADGMRELAVAQLGSKGVVDDVEFAKRLAEKTIRVLLPKLFRSLRGATAGTLSAADRCEAEGTEEAACAAADAAWAATRAAANAAAWAAHYAAAYAASAAYAAKAARAKAAAANANAKAARAKAAAANANANAANAAAYAANAATYAADGNAADGNAANSEEYLRLSAALAVETLRELGSPGVEFLVSHAG